MGANIVISPVGVLKEGTLTVNGSGFSAAEGVDVMVVVQAGSSPIDISLGTSTANDSGAFSETFNLPSSVDVGVWTVRAVGNAGGRASAPILVLQVAK
ncbi:MAG: hypothetical protein V3U26_06860 [Dehalococcoidia bacterium]